MNAGKTPAPRLCPEWDPYPETTTDWRGREIHICRNCQRPGEPDDPGHTPPPPPAAPRTRLSPAVAAAAQQRDAAILGEHDPEDHR